MSKRIEVQWYENEHYVQGGKPWVLRLTDEESGSSTSVGASNLLTAMQSAMEWFGLDVEIRRV